MRTSSPAHIFHDAWVQVEQLSQRMNEESDPVQRATWETQRARFQSILDRAPSLPEPVGPQANELPASEEEMVNAWDHMLAEACHLLLQVP